MMNLYTSRKRYNFERAMNVIAIIGLVLLFCNMVLYMFSRLPIHGWLCFVGIVMMCLPLIKWYDD